jgi:hypothetical protein
MSGAGRDLGTMLSSRYETRISESRCRRHLRERPASEERVGEDDRTEESRRASAPVREAAGRDLVDEEDGEAEGVRGQAGREEDVDDLPWGRRRHGAAPVLVIVVVVVADVVVVVFGGSGG